MKSIKLMTLNIWCYFDWSNRVDNIKTLIDNEKPDIIAFQEVQINTHYSDTPSSSSLVQDKYPYHIYEPSWGAADFMPYDEHLITRKSHGLAIASRYPIVSHEVIRLALYPGRTEPAIALLCKLNIDDVDTYVCNVHFDNTDESSKAQLQELMLYFKKLNITPIILGDFNNFSLKDFSKTILSDYYLSTDILDYTSMPKNNGTLDYVVAPKNGQIKSVICPEVYVSDHRSVIAMINIT